MRVLSARIDPPVRRDDGSTASTATLRPCLVSMVLSVSIIFDSPTPGELVMPTRTALPVVGNELVAPVRPGEIPAFEPPAPQVSAHVPDYERVPRPAIDAGE